MVIVPINGKARHGKDTFAQMLKAELEAKGKRVLIVRFADYLKFIAKEYFGWNGEKDEVGRTLLQFIGTDRVRAKYEDFWVETVARLLWIFEHDFDVVLIPDARFPNEVSFWHYWGEVLEADTSWTSVSVKVVRPDFDNGLTDEQKNHPSETSLDGHDFDYVFESRTLDELKENVKRFANII